MKTLFLFTFSVLLAISLNARENPFALYEEETGVMYDFNENLNTPEAIQEAEYIKKIQQKMKNANKNQEELSSKLTTPPPAKTYTKQEVDSLLKKTKQQTEQEAKAIVKKEIAKTKQAPEQVVYVKPRDDLDEKTTTIVDTTTTTTALTTKNILPFVKIDFDDNKLLIYSNYPMFKKFSIDEENKLAFDYRAKVSFKSKKDNLNSKNFKVATVGNHTKSDFFRVVIKLENKPSKYNVEYKGNIVMITSK